MRRVLVTLVGALALAGALSLPAHAEPGPGVIGILGEPVRANSNIGGIQLGQLPLGLLSPQ